MLPECRRIRETIYGSVLRSGDVAIDMDVRVGRHKLLMAEAIIGHRMRVEVNQTFVRMR